MLKMPSKKMSSEEAISWLSNETSAYTITEYKKKYGDKAAFEKVKEAIDVAIEALRRDEIRRVK